VVDDAIVFPTTPYSELAMYGPGSKVAFEVDDVDYGRQTGWSVVATGSLETLETDDLEELRAGWVPQPWAGGHRHLHLRLRWREISGRRIREGHATTVPVRPSI
jgi:hypothetical protein